MKTSKFFSLFVILLFTAATSVSAQTKNWSTVGQDQNKPGTGAFKTGTEWAAWLQSGTAPSWVVPYDNCDANCVAAINKVGAAYSLKQAKVLIFSSNKDANFFTNQPFTEEVLTSVWSKFVGTLSIVNVQFDDSIAEMCLTYNTANNTYGMGWMIHPPGIRPSVVSNQNGQIYAMADDSCGQTYSEQTSRAIINSRARIVSPTANASTPPGPGPLSAGNGAGTIPAADFAALLAAIKASSGSGQAPIIIYAGNGNGNNNGVTGAGMNGTNGRDGQNGTNAGNSTNTTPATQNPFVSWTPVQPFTIPAQTQSVPGGGGQWVPTQTVPLNTINQNATACGNCGGYQLTQADVALGQRQNQTMIAQNEKTNKLLKTGNGLAGWNAFVNTVGTGFEIADDFGAFNKFKVAPILNQFNSFTVSTATVDAIGHSVDFNNGGGANNCPLGYHWDGTQCVQ